MLKRDLQSPRTLNRNQREAIFDATVKKVTRQYFDPNFNGTEWPSLAEKSRSEITAIDNPEAFELAVHDLVRKLGTSHTGFFHQSVKRVPGRLAIGVTFTKAIAGGKHSWVIQDLHVGGPADRAGLERLDTLVAIGEKLASPDVQPMFPMGTDVPIRVRRALKEHTVVVSIPAPRSRKQPYAEPQAVLWKHLTAGVGYIKVTIFPGLLGLDVAREIDAAFENLSTCNALVLDLRGNLGGGLGVLRLMSHLTPDRLPIGYTVTRKRAEIGYEKESLPSLDRLPTNMSNTLGVATMLMRFAGRDPSVKLLSEGLGPKRWHGNVAILVNEHTVSAGEMIAAFAAENRLAKIVGTETAGRLIPGSGFKVGRGYMLIIPKAAYITWSGQRFEGRGVFPDIEVPWSIDAAEVGTDHQLAMAARALKP